MYDKRIVRGTALCRKNACHRVRLKDVSAQAVYRFRGKNHNATPAHVICGLLKIRRGKVSRCVM